MQGLSSEGRAPIRKDGSGSGPGPRLISRLLRRQLHGAPQLIQDNAEILPRPRINRFASKLRPSPGINGLRRLEEGCRLIELQHVTGLEMKPGPDPHRNGDLPLGCKGRFHGGKVRRHGKAIKVRREIGHGVTRPVSPSTRPPTPDFPLEPSPPRTTFDPVRGIDFRFVQGGLHLPARTLWLDAHQPVGPGETVFVSHAHSDHTADHAEVILTEPTRRLMRARVGGTRTEHVLPFGQSVDLRDLLARPHLPHTALTLLPAGHVLGSAMSLLESDDGSLLYTGDFKLRAGASSEPCQTRHADTLVMETTFGRPEYVFPPTAEVLAGILRFCREAIDNDEIPILLGYSLGKAQEILAALRDAGLPTMLTDAVARLTAVYEGLGIPFPSVSSLDPARAAGHVVVAPPGGNLQALRRKLGSTRVAVLTGWAINPGCRFQYQADAAFPLSDHADYPDLVDLVRRVNPRRVFTLHGFAAEFAADLRAAGIEAWALSQEEQLELGIGRSVNGLDALTPARSRLAEAPAPTPTPEPQPAGPESLAAFAALCRAVAAERSKLAKTRLVAAYLRALPAPTVPPVTAWLTGNAFGPGDGRSLQVGGAALRDAVCEVAGLTPDDFRNAYLKHSDTGDTAAELLSRRPVPAVESPSLAETIAAHDRIADARTAAGKRAQLSALLHRCDAPTARAAVKIVTGNLRIGLKEGLVEEAIAEAFNVPPERVRRANLLIGDLGQVAGLAQAGQLAHAGLVPGRPVKVMLASPEPTANEVWQRVLEWQPTPDAATATDAGAWVEHKYDGIRCQAHRVDGRVRLWTRDLKEVTGSFPELVTALGALPADVILDGEILAVDGERIRPFADLQRRLGRVGDDLFLGGDIPVAYVAFDLLWESGTDHLDHPLAERRARLEALPGFDGLTLRRARVERISTREALSDAFARARAAGNEGLMIKDPASTYAPGRRGLSWIKWKQALATLDCVIVGAEYGHGRRRTVLSDYTFAVRNDSGALKVIGKAYSGLTDAEIADLTGHLLAATVRQRGRYHEVRPEIVLEIAFDRIQPSNRHDSGLALRFPRIVRIRTDKRPADIDTLATARRLCATPC